MSIIIILWVVFFLIVFEAMIGYPISLLLLQKVIPKKNIDGNYTYEPEVTIMVVAHNEEKVISSKIENLFSLDYPKDKLHIIITSDASTDATNDIVEDYIRKYPSRDIVLHKTIHHKGKTNAQNEAQKKVNSEILIMTDANSMIEKSAIKHIVKPFISKDVAYVCGKLVYINEDRGGAAQSEGFYWKLDLLCRKIESNIQTITAGNGALYACRNSYYIDIPDINSHDATFPLIYALDGKKALYLEEALVYEKAGETYKDEYKRKVRMNRGIIKNIIPDIRIFNFFKHKWFSYFYFGHRTCRYLLWLSHFMLLVLNIPLMFECSLWYVIFGLQILFYICALIGGTGVLKNKMTLICYYYCMVIVSQWHAVIRTITGRNKPIWDKAESTR